MSKVCNHSVFKILIVETDAASRQLLRLMLGDNNCVMIEATSRDEAISKYIQERPDIVILDTYMGNYNGFEVCKQMTQISAVYRTPIVMVSNFSDHKYIEQGYEAGAVDYITKPFDLFELRSRIRLILENCDSKDPLNNVAFRSDSTKTS